MNDLLTAEDFLSVGYIGGLHGYNGSLRVILDFDMEKLSDDMISFLYFSENGMFVPHFIESWDTDQSLIRFERIQSREEARRLTDQKVYLRKRDLPETISVNQTKARQWNVLRDYRIFDVEQDVLVGTIKSIEEYPAGWMAEVLDKNPKKTILIPMAEPLIDRVDEENMIVYMKLPSGLVEL